MEYKYSLEKNSKKHICPKCGEKRFVRYLNLSNDNYFDEEFGRCDRETSCGHHTKPSSCDSYISYVPFVPKPIANPTFHSIEIVENSNKRHEINSFIQFLFKYFPEEQILESIAKYHIGTSKHWNGATVFWQIDQLNNIHAGKVFLFDKCTGKRIKKPYPHINWVHKIIKQEDFILQQCLFGLHLVKELLQRPIAIVESEKTAIIMSLFMPENIWLATGSKQNLKYDLLRPLINHEIIIFPDKGEFENWNKKSDELQKLNFKIKCSQFVEKSKHEIGTDLADIYIYERNQKPSTTQTDIIYNETEKTIQRLAVLNPEIITLINLFDLIDDKGNGIRLGI
ncbi:MAG: hypothetical protein GZ091_14130 [Paludibacter sp.]|nr:hypothetical protein [Paludibacter sp.]